MRTNYAVFGYALFAFFSTPLAAQRSVNLRSQVLSSFATVGDSCIVIGDGSNGRPEGLLRVTGAAFGSNGLVIVSNSGTSEVLVFEGTGPYRRSVTQAGGGPSDLSRGSLSWGSLKLVPYRGDSVVVYDARQRKFVVFDGIGRFGRTIRVDSQPEFASRAFVVAGISANGDLVIGGTALPPRPVQARESSQNRLVQDTIRLIRMAADGRVIWQSPPIEDDVYEVNSRVVAGRNSGSATIISRGGTSLPTNRMPTVALGHRVVYHYSERSNELHIYDRSGVLAIRVRLPAMPVPPALTAGNREKQSLSMLGDYAGHAWIEVPRDSPRTSREWWVVSEQGQLLGTVFTSRAEVLAVGPRHILARATDRDGVEVLRSCPLRIGK